MYHRVNDVVNIRLAHRWKQWQRANSVAIPLCIQKVVASPCGWMISEPSVCMHSTEVDAATNILRLERRHKFGSVNASNVSINAHNKQMP
jgi:hypothetical protein